MIKFILDNIGYLLWIILFIILASQLHFRKKLQQAYLSLQIFVLVLIYSLYWISQGLDITDEGFTLSKSWFMLHGMWHENMDLIWGSNLINGLWLSIIGAPSVLWARLGFVLVTSGTSCVSFIILKKYFNPIKSFWMVFIVTILITSSAAQTINYNNLPVLLILLSIFFLLKNEYLKNFKALFISGILIGFTIYTRLFFISFIFLPFIIFIWRYYQNNEIKILKKQILYSSFGILIGLIIGLIILIATSSFNIYINTIAKTFYLLSNTSEIQGHTQNQLIAIYKENLWFTSMNTLIFIFLFFIPAIISKASISKYLKYIFFILLGYLLFIYATEKGNSQNWIYVTIALSFASIILYLFNTKNYRHVELILCSYLFMLFSFIGSSSGIQMIFYSGSGILAISLSFLFIEKLSFNLLNNNLNFKPVIYILIGFSILLLYDRKKVDVYRERPRNELKTKFETKALWGIYSHPERVNAIDSLIVNFNKLAKKNQTVLTINANQMFYYLTNFKYYLSDLWNVPHKEFEEKIEKEAPPDYLIFSIKNPRNPNWPIDEEFPVYDFDLVNYTYFKEYAKSNYILIYSNKMFELYGATKNMHKIISENIVMNNAMSTFENGLAKSWNKIRENTLATKDSLIFHSKPYSTRITAPNNVFAGIMQKILEEGQLYYCEAWVYSNEWKEFSIDIGGGASSIKKVVPPNIWTKISGYGKAVSPLLYVCVTLGNNDGFFYYYDDVVIKKVELKK
ncbi:MAG: hypothetical protein HOO91_04865 [Bacteroidales bacterium]|nr:hypothetical protein [Bacteroidales bacterium]